MNKREHRDLIAQYFLADVDIERGNLHDRFHDALDHAYGQVAYCDSEIIRRVPIRSKRDKKYYLIRMIWRHGAGTEPRITHISKIKFHSRMGRYSYSLQETDNTKHLIDEFAIVVFRRYNKVKDIMDNLQSLDVPRNERCNYLTDIFINESRIDDYEWGLIRKKKAFSQIRDLYE